MIDFSKYFPVHVAAAIGHLEMTKYLVDHVCEHKSFFFESFMKLRDKDDRTAADIAKLNGHKKVKKFLEDRTIST